ncbi:DsbA family protein [Marinobacterium maritimum]
MNLPALTSRIFLRALGCLAAGVLMFMPPAQADEVSEPDPALVEQVKAAVMQELKDSDFLQKEVDAGIEAYVAREREARARAQQQARLEQERLAAENLQNVRRYTEGRDHLYGDPKAAITLIEYSDFECPYCKRFHATPKKLVEQFDGQLNWVYRHFPLSFHNPGAQKQAEASECISELGGDEAFWRFTDTIYQRTRSGGRGFPLNQLVPLAEELGLDGASFQQCLDSGKYAERVQEELMEGKKLGITGTPGSVLVNNVTGQAVLKVGALPVRVFEGEIKKMLSESTDTVSESTQ